MANRDFAEMVAEMQARMADPEWQAENARIQERADADARRMARDERVRALDTLMVPLRVGMAQVLATIPRHLDASECDCYKNNREVKCVVPDGYQDTKTLSVVRKWLDIRRKQPANWKPILVLLGGVGIGKTSAAAWAVSMQVSAAYVKSRTLTAAHRQMFGDARKEWDNMMRASMLFLDDLGRETDENGVAAVEDLVDERQGKPTIITGNITKENLLARYGDRVKSRLSESSVMVWLQDEDKRYG